MPLVRQQGNAPATGAIQCAAFEVPRRGIALGTSQREPTVCASSQQIGIRGGLTRAASVCSLYLGGRGSIDPEELSVVTYRQVFPRAIDEAVHALGSQPP